MQKQKSLIWETARENMGGIGGVQKNEVSDVSKVFMHGILNKLNLKLVDLNTKVITLNIYQVSLAWKQKKKKKKKNRKRN